MQRYAPALVGGPEQPPRCDSSDCLFCQGGGHQGRGGGDDDHHGGDAAKAGVSRAAALQLVFDNKSASLCSSSSGGDGDASLVALVTTTTTGDAGGAGGVTATAAAAVSTAQEEEEEDQEDCNRLATPGSTATQWRRRRRQHEQQQEQPPPQHSQSRPQSPSSPLGQNFKRARCSLLCSSSACVACGGASSLHEEKTGNRGSSRGQQQQHISSSSSSPSSSTVVRTSCLRTSSSSLVPALLHGAVPWTCSPEQCAAPEPAPCRMVQVAALRPRPGGSRADMLGALDFSDDGRLLATGSVSKQVALYSLSDLLPSTSSSTSSTSITTREAWSSSSSNSCNKAAADTTPCCELRATVQVRMSARVSALAWNPAMEGVLTVGDHDGCLTLLHVTSGHYICELDAHSGRRILSVAHSRLRPGLVATAAGDATAQLWAAGRITAATPMATLRPPGGPAVCGVDFSPSNPDMVALAAADSRIYLYDLRATATPLATLHGHHTRAVSYARFASGNSLVSASIDGTVAMWALPAAWAGSSPCCAWDKNSNSSSSSSSSSSGGNNITGSGSSTPQLLSPPPPPPPPPAAALAPWRVFRGHSNQRCFVGLSAQQGGSLVAVGSESGEVFAYHTAWSTPLARQRIHHTALFTQQHHQQEQQDVAAQLSQPAVVTTPWSSHHHHYQQQQQLKQQQQESSPQVCAVAWQPTPAAEEPLLGACCWGAAPLLATGTTSGECRLLALVKATPS